MLLYPFPIVSKCIGRILLTNSLAFCYTLNYYTRMEYCIIYLSSSRGLWSEEQLERISILSQRNNRALGITGILLYFNGSIIQVLEGPEDQVKSLYEVIHQDTQHTHVICMYNNSIQQRSFSDWSMGYKTISASEFAHLKDQLPFMSDPASLGSKEDSIILSIVKQFYFNNRQN